MIDFHKDFARNFFNHCHCKFISKSYANFFNYVVNSNAGQAGVNQCLYLVAVYIIATHICNTGNHSYLYIHDASNICWDGDWENNKTT